MMECMLVKLNRMLSRAGLTAESIGNRWLVSGVIFTLAVLSRVYINLLFYILYGFHAVNHVETWFYKGVMDGTLVDFLTNRGSDPTAVFLQFIGFFTPPEFRVYAVVGFGILLSAVTCVLIYNLVSRIYGVNCGFFAGLVYCFGVQPMALCLTGFTHDNLALPTLMLTLLLGYMAVHSKPVYSLVYTIFFVGVVSAGRLINETVNVGFGIAVIYGVYQLYLWAHRYLPKNVGVYLSKDYAKKLFFISLICVLLALSFVVVPKMLSSILEDLPQGRFGSADVRPISLNTLWLRYGFLIFLLPAMLFSAYKRVDIHGVSLLFLGLGFALQMDRGSRIMDLGFAILAAIAVEDLVKSKKFDIHIIWSAAVTLFMLIYSEASAKYYLAALGVGVGVYWSLKRSPHPFVYTMLFIALSGIAVNTIYIFSVEGRQIVSDTEFMLYSWLSENNVGGRVLAGWDRGYLIHAVSGLIPVSSPNGIKWDVHDFLWMPSQQAALNLARHNISYIMVSSENFNVVSKDDEIFYRIVGGLIDKDGHIPSPKFVQRYSIYKLRHGVGGEYFDLLKHVKDPATGIEYMLYGVNAPNGAHYGGGWIGGIASNYGKSRKYQILASTHKVYDDGFQRKYFNLDNVTFEGESISEVVFETGIQNNFDCRLRAESMEGDLRYGGKLSFENPGGEKTATIRLTLVDKNTGEDKSVFVKPQLFKGGEKVAVDYEFKFVQGFGNYGLQMDEVEGIIYLPFESGAPEPLTVTFDEVFC